MRCVCARLRECGHGGESMRACVRVAVGSARPGKKRGDIGNEKKKTMRWRCRSNKMLVQLTPTVFMCVIMPIFIDWMAMVDGPSIQDGGWRRRGLSSSHTHYARQAIFCDCVFCAWCVRSPLKFRLVFQFGIRCSNVCVRVCADVRWLLSWMVRRTWAMDVCFHSPNKFNLVSGRTLTGTENLNVCKMSGPVCVETLGFAAFTLHTSYTTIWKWVCGLLSAHIHTHTVRAIVDWGVQMFRLICESYLEGKGNKNMRRTAFPICGALLYTL